MNSTNLPPEIQRFIIKMADKNTPIKVLDWEIYERTIIGVEYRFDQIVRTTYLRTDDELSDEKIE